MWLFKNHPNSGGFYITQLFIIEHLTHPHFTFAIYWVNNLISEHIYCLTALGIYSFGEFQFTEYFHLIESINILDICWFRKHKQTVKIIHGTLDKTFWICFLCQM